MYLFGLDGKPIGIISCPPKPPPAWHWREVWAGLTIALFLARVFLI